MPDSLLSDTREGLVDRVFEAIDNRNDADVSLRDLAEAVVDDLELVDLVAVLKPHLSEQTIEQLRENAAAAHAVGDHLVATAIEFLLKWHEDARAALEKANG